MTRKPNDKNQKGERLEDFRSFRKLLNDENQKKGMSEWVTKKRINKPQNWFCARETQMRKQATELEVETK